MGGKSGDDTAAYYRAQDEAKQQAIAEGTASIDDIFSQFDDTFYDQQRQNYLDYAMPQLEDQRVDAARDLTYALARQGQLGSSARATQEGDLQQLFDLQSQNVVDTALDKANAARRGVEGARSDLVSLLNTTGDADAAAQGALARSASLTQQEAYSPLADAFTSFTSALGTADAAARARSYGAGGTQYSGLGAQIFGASPKSTVVRS
jgi:hypothetical protein